MEEESNGELTFLNTIEMQKMKSSLYYCFLLV